LRRRRLDLTGWPVKSPTGATRSACNIRNSAWARPRNT